MKTFVIAKLQNTKTKKSTNIVVRLAETNPTRYRYEILDIQADSVTITCADGQVQGNNIYVTVT